MRKFEFRLQRVLDLAERAEELARRDAAQALSRLHSAEEAEAGCRARVDATLAEITDRLGAGDIDPARMRVMHACLAREQEQVRLHKVMTVEAEARHSELHDIMTEKRRELLALERAKENAWETWRAEAAKAELEEIEDVTAGRYARRIPEA